MKSSHASLAALTLLLATGAGCFGLGGQSTSSSALGGLWLTESAGDTWVSKSVLPTADGLSSIDGLDILTIEQDPSDASVIYLGSKTSGLFYSIDGGETWQRPEDKVAASGSVLAIEVDPRDVCTYYALKPDRVLKTTTCGREFNTEAYVETNPEETLTAMALDWYNPNTLLIGTSQGDVLRSLDAGASWTAILRANNTIIDLDYSHADSRIVLVGTRTQGVYRSADGGISWIDLEDQLKEYRKADNVYGFSQTAGGKRILLRSAYGLLSSDDVGLTWKPVYLVSSAGDVIVRAATISPTNKDVMYYSAGNTFYASTTGGSAWSTTNMPTTRAASVIHVDEGNPERIFMGGITLDD